MKAFARRPEAGDSRCIGRCQGYDAGVGHLWLLSPIVTRLESTHELGI